MKNKIYGVGINDAGYVVKYMDKSPCGKQFQTWVCPYYDRWKLMLKRCYDPSSLKQHSTYKKNTVCDEWLIFSNFKAWMETQDWVGKYLDKDYLSNGCKEYSPNTCAFVSREVNNFITDSKAKRGSLPVGVTCFLTKGLQERYIVRCGNPITLKREYLGVFPCKTSAAYAWLSRKHEIALMLAEIETNTLVANKLKTIFMSECNYEKFFGYPLIAKQKVKMLVATDETCAIGYNGKLPWYIKEDLKYFKRQTEFSTVIMGRTTFEGLPFEGGLQNRRNIIVTNTIQEDTGWCEFKNMEDTLKLMKEYDGTICVVGGKSVYEQLFHLIDEIHHTVIKGDYECDTFIDTSMWEDDIDWCLEEIKTLSEVAEVKIWRKC